MSLLKVLMQAEAAAQQRAVRATAFRHTYLAKKPFIVCVYNLSGEAAAPIAIVYGQDRPKIVVSAEPRNRESRFGALNVFSKDLFGYIQPFLELQEVQQSSRGKRFVVEKAVDMPQIIAPNRATRDYLGTKLGRYLRYLNVSQKNLVPEETLWAGAHLSWLADQQNKPGQCLFLAATELLNSHFVTGQSDFENQNLATLIAWIENPAKGGLAEIRKAENLSPYGPTPAPEFEEKLEPLVRDYTIHLRNNDRKGLAAVEMRIQKMTKPVLEEAFFATKRALEILNQIPEAASVEKRYNSDLHDWTRYCWRARHGLPRFKVRHDALLAAEKLEEWSHALQELEVDSAFDDPLILAELDAQGLCIRGTVAKCDLANHEVKPGNKRRTQVPLITIKIDGPIRLLVGGRVTWVEERKVKAEIRKIPDPGDKGTVELALLQGHGKGTRTPRKGSEVIFVALEAFAGRAPETPDQVPWTHRAQEEDNSQEDVKDTPDMTADEILRRPLVGIRKPDEIPPVVL